MPAMDGFESTKVILDLYKSMKILPNPYVIGVGNQYFNQRGKEAGMNEMIEKPINRDKIYNYLRKLRLTDK